MHLRQQVAALRSLHRHSPSFAFFGRKGHLCLGTLARMEGDEPLNFSGKKQVRTCHDFPFCVWCVGGTTLRKLHNLDPNLNNLMYIYVYNIYIDPKRVIMYIVGT